MPTTRVEAWERRTDVPLLALALAFLIAYAWPILDPHLEQDLATFLRAVSWAVWAVFAIDLAIRLALAEDRLRYARRKWYDVALVLVPMLRPLRLLRVLAFASILTRTLGGRLAGRVAVYIAGTSIALIFLGGLAVLDAERGAPGATITSYGDAIWWALVTTTTVGYGDFYPVTTEGRIIAAVLMVVGIALLGAVTGGVASWFVEQLTTDEEESARD